MIQITSSMLYKIAPKFSGQDAKNQSTIIQTISHDLSSVLERYQINTKLRIAHFLAQITHESAGLRTTEEFASGSAYDGRVDLGNIYPGDGKRYKGRGLIQLTGRANYRLYGKKLNLLLEEFPNMAAEPSTSLLIACEYWKDRNINKAADLDDIKKVTKLVNGGLNGLEDRAKYLFKALAVLDNVDGPPQHNQLIVGSNGDEVEYLQKLLIKKGMKVLIDGDFGNNTKKAVIAFQQASKLDPNGIVDKSTWNALEA